MIYAISDVHGCVDALEEALSFVDLADGQSRLIAGGVMRTGCIPVLAYDEEADTYSEISSRGSRQLVKAV